jgi:GNAT superfamily N-acetyltransferase
MKRKFEISSQENVTANLKFHPVTPEKWKDLVSLFGERGACGGCWCMWWRMTRSEFSQKKGEANKKALKKIVDSGEIPGILAYVGKEPIGWCSVAPREAFSSLDRSRILKKVDDQPVWSVVCFYVAKPFRNKGITVALLKAVIGYVKKQGGKIVEGYPIQPKTKKFPDVFANTGLASAFLQVGFEEVGRRSKTRPIMRYLIK